MQQVEPACNGSLATRWCAREEYLSVIDAVEINSYRLVEISLTNYTMTGNQMVLRANMDKWQRDLMKTYTGLGIGLASNLTNGTQNIYGVNIQYNMSIATDWNKTVSFSAANVTFELNITSVGLYGYKFITPVFLKMSITDALWYEGQGSNPDEIGVRVVIESEGPRPVANLRESNFLMFQVNGVPLTQNFTLYRYYESQSRPLGASNPEIPALNTFVYELRYDGVSSNPETLNNVTISIMDTRNIQVTGQTFNLTVVDAYK